MATDAHQVNRSLSAEDILRAVFDVATSTLRTGATVEGSDIQLGAVELKNALTDARAEIGDPDDLTIESISLAVADKRVLAILGAIAGVAVVTDANGTLQQYMRGLVKLEAARVGAGTAAAAGRVTLASDDPLLAQVRIAAPTVNSSIATASAADAVLADTGALAAGTYLVEASAGISGDALDGKHLLLQHRDAANTGNTATLGLVPAGGAMAWSFSRVVVANTERIRIVVGSVAVAAGEVSQACVRAHLVG